MHSACKTPFGVEWGHRHNRSLVKDVQMTASSSESGSEAHFGRLGFSSKAWCPHGNMIHNQYTQKKQYLQIEFIFASKVTGVSTQGLGSKYVTFYNLYYALDTDMFHCYVNEYGLCKVSHQTYLHAGKINASAYKCINFFSVKALSIAIICNSLL